MLSEFVLGKIEINDHILGNCIERDVLGKNNMHSSSILTLIQFL